MSPHLFHRRLSQNLAATVLSFAASPNVVYGTSPTCQELGEQAHGDVFASQLRVSFPEAILVAIGQPQLFLNSSDSVQSVYVKVSILTRDVI